MSFQKGQVVLLEGSEGRPHINGQRGVLLERDSTCGRWRVRLSAEPWKVVKVARDAMQAVDASGEDGDGGDAKEALAASGDFSCFHTSMAKCDYLLGSFQKVQRQVLPPHMMDRNFEKSNLPPSPVKLGKLDHQAPLPRIDPVSIMQDEMREQVKGQTRRRVVTSNFKDAELEHIIGLPTRKAPVQLGKPHRLLCQANSEDLKALFEEDFDIEFQRKIDVPRYAASSVPKQGFNVVFDQQRDEDMDERLQRIQQRANLARQDRSKAAKEQEEMLQKELRKARAPPQGATKSVSAPTEPKRATGRKAEESEEQRISREFKEYEIESATLTHSPEAKRRSRDGSMTGGIDEGFEEEDEAPVPNGQLPDETQPAETRRSEEPANMRVATGDEEFPELSAETEEQPLVPQEQDLPVT